MPASFTILGTPQQCVRTANGFLLACGRLVRAVLGDAIGLDTLIADCEAKKGGGAGRDLADTSESQTVRMKSLDSAVVTMARHP